MKRSSLIASKWFRRYCVRVAAKFERVFLGLDFQGGASAASLGLNPKVSNDCMPSGGRYIKKIFEELDVNNDDSILDIGCGKGCAMRTMHRFPFKYIHGIELSHEIATIAKTNFQKMKSNRANVFNLNATDFDGYANYNMYYMYNPFPAEVVARVIELIIDQNRNESIVIIYNNPVHHQQVERFGFNKIKEYPDEWGNGIFLYTNSCKNAIF